ncbi:MAG: hypothetical protein ACEQSA_03780 [Weeksellaceae bacterium]
MNSFIAALAGLPRVRIIVAGNVNHAYQTNSTIVQQLTDDFDALVADARFNWDQWIEQQWCSIQEEPNTVLERIARLMMCLSQSLPYLPAPEVIETFALRCWSDIVAGKMVCACGDYNCPARFLPEIMANFAELRAMEADARSDDLNGNGDWAKQND